VQTLSDTETLLQLALIVVLAIGAPLIAPRLRVPAILLLLAAGFVAGASGALDTDALLGDLVNPIVSLATGIILLEGGLRLSLRGLAGGHGRVVRRSITLGVAVTLALTTLAARGLLDVSWQIAAVLGAILVVSGPTVVGPLLDFIRPSRAVDTVLRWEGTLVDPVGALLGVVIFQIVLNQSLGSGHGIGSFVVAIAIGVGFGLAGALVLLAIVRALHLDLAESRAAAILVAVAVVAGADALSDDSGLLATLLMGMMIANLYFERRTRSLTAGSRIEFAKSVRQFDRAIEGVASFLIGVLFILLSSRVSADDIADLGPVVLAFLALLILVVRPASVALWTAGSALSARERGFVAWMAPRGIIAAATSSSFALSLGAKGVAGADELVPVTFVVIVGTALVYGLSGRPVAAALGVAGSGPAGVVVAGADALALGIARALSDADVRAVLAPLGRPLEVAPRHGVEVYEGDVLSDLAGSEPSVLDGVGVVLLVTDSDELSSVLATDLGNLGVRARVFQVAPEGEAGSGGSLFRRAPVLFDRRATHAQLAQRLAAGARFSARAVADGPGGRDDGVPLFVLTGASELRVVAADTPVHPLPGQVVISLTGPE
jgi:NhaP-type Na+/H+ or K+/H+ antiporter